MCVVRRVRRWSPTCNTELCASCSYGSRRSDWETSIGEEVNESTKKSFSSLNYVRHPCSLHWVIHTQTKKSLDAFKVFWEVGTCRFGNFGEHNWMENFRMSRGTFKYLCEQLKPLIDKRNTRMRKSISTERRLAINLWVLATPGEYCTVAHLFGIARLTVCKITNETCRAIVQKLLPVYIRFPTGDGLKEVVRGFKDKWGVPQCAGSIDGSHVPVTPPALNHTDYYNRKGWYSVLVQAVVDHNYLFTDLCIGWPGGVHDARVLANSSIFKKVSSGIFLQGEEQVQGQTLRRLLLGDSAYPLIPFLIKPFSFSSSLTFQQKNCNYRLSRARVVVEISFGRLKARWRRLSKQVDFHIDNVPHIIAACCALHNMCEIHHDSFNEEWLQEVNLDEPDSVPDTSTPTPSGTGGDRVRNILMDYFEHNPWKTYIYHVIIMFATHSWLPQYLTI